jgi:hypothetical protein
MPQAFIHWLFHCETMGEIPREMGCGGNDNGAGFISSFFGFPLIIVILSLLPTRLSQSPEACYIPKQAAHYHILGLGASSPLRPCTWLVIEYGNCV